MRKAPRLPLRLWRGFARGAGLSLGLWASGAAADCVSRAEYDGPTTRYAHGVLGDDVEYGALKLWVQGLVKTVILPQDRVFEDLEPRLVDVDLDGCNDVIVVESQADRGAQLAAYAGSGEKIAATPHIGRRNRWLAPIGAADMDGDGHVEIAYIDRPHLAKTLRVWRFKDGGLTEVASAPGFTNHRIGWDYIEGGVRDCGQGPEMIVADGGWQRVIALQLEGGRLTSRDLGRYASSAVEAAMACK
ncbi:FG-GAP repeat domain-containing protein [Pacificoceanicola onchidii]|uniref:FG-GAP repeat domain-containing protein n=1 Tax=Pacificoceanicola onchidii TaxID=2562685 RepID=UPI001455FA60|nr:VCBS repeat-containing protein [Pacificoceanicola onchidii]